MQSAVSTSFYRPEYGEFLYAPVGGAPDEMPLSVLSALARLNIDPWMEAAALAALPNESATRRLALLLGQLPGERWSERDRHQIAARLTKLLPQTRSSTAPDVITRLERPAGLKITVGWQLALLVVAALSVIVLILHNL